MALFYKYATLKQNRPLLLAETEAKKDPFMKFYKGVFFFCKA